MPRIRWSQAVIHGRDPTWPLLQDPDREILTSGSPAPTLGTSRPTSPVSPTRYQEVISEIRSRGVIPDPAPEPSMSRATSCSSIAGDSVISDSVINLLESDSVVSFDTSTRAVCEYSTGYEQQQKHFAPKLPIQGTVGASSLRNQDPEVGNVGIFYGNWGVRGSFNNDEAKKRKRDQHDKQIMRCPAQVIVLCEASAGVETLLQQAAVAGTAGASGLDGRNTSEHWVVRGNEPDAAVLIAARKDVSTGVQLLDYEVYDDHQYMQRSVRKWARSRQLVVRIGFKQNVGHLGTDIVVCGVHGHYRTMKREWPQAWTAFWDRLADKIKRFQIKILAGDFNMSFTQVRMQLRSRGIVIDCIAWYPWRHATTATHGQSLGFDSCGIFYIGGAVTVKLNWSLRDLSVLTSVAANGNSQWKGVTLDLYAGQNHPGQPWGSYRHTKYNEVDTDKNLQLRLEELLTFSTTTEQADSIPKREGSMNCAYLRFKEKPLNKQEWESDGVVPNGAHFPLCVFTDNSSARSQQGHDRRMEIKNNKRQYSRPQSRNTVRAFDQPAFDQPAYINTARQTTEGYWVTPYSSGKAPTGEIHYKDGLLWQEVDETESTRLNQAKALGVAQGAIAERRTWNEALEDTLAALETPAAVAGRWTPAVADPFPPSGASSSFQVTDTDMHQHVRGLAVNFFARPDAIGDRSLNRDGCYPPIEYVRALAFKPPPPPGTPPGYPSIGQPDPKRKPHPLG